MIRSGEHAVWDAHLAKLGALSNINTAAHQLGRVVEEAVEGFAQAFRDALPMMAEALRRMP